LNNDRTLSAEREAKQLSKSQNDKIPTHQVSHTSRQQQQQQPVP